MTYKLESFIEKITSPVLVEYNGEMQEFPNGASAYAQTYSKYLFVKEMKVVNGKICLVLKENDRENDSTWCGEEQATFFE